MSAPSSLPPHPDLRPLRNQAKALLKAHQAADPEAANRLRQALPELADQSDAEIFQAKLALKAAQRAIACEYGFEEWADLKRHVEALQEAGRPTEDGGNSAEVETIRRAVEAGDAETVEALLKAHPALAPAKLERGNYSEMACLTLLHRADAKAPGKKMTPGHLQVAQLLIDHGADVNAIVDGYSPPLDVSAWSGNVEMVKLLLANGADPNLGTEATPVESAASHNHREVFKCLIEAGAVYGIEHTIQLGMLKETRALVDADPSRANTPTPSGALPLNLAAGKQGIFTLLLRRGADVHARDAKGYTSLLAARAVGNDKAVQELLRRGVPDDIFGAIAERDEATVAAFLRDDLTMAHPVGDGPAPILWAVRTGSTRIVELLLGQKVNVNIWRDTWAANTPLLAAISYHHDDLVQQLLDYGADPDPHDVRDWPGCTIAPEHRPYFPLHYGEWGNPLACSMRWGTVRSTMLLLEAGADPNHGRGLGWPAQGGGLERAKLLIDWGADMQGLTSERALRKAAEFGRTLMVELLATHGVDIEATKEPWPVWPPRERQSPYKNDRTALQWATEKGHAETAALIRELSDIRRLPVLERDRILRSRAQFIDAAIDGDADTVRQLLQEEPALLDRKIAQVDLLRHAAYNGQQAVADVLVEGGAPWTVVAAAALGRVEQVEALLADDPLLLQSPEPLFAAAIGDQAAVIEFLLDRGANIDRQDPGNEWTALHEAVGRQSMNAVEILVARGAKVNLKEQYGRTPLKLIGQLTADGKKIRDLLLAHGETQ